MSRSVRMMMATKKVNHLNKSLQYPQFVSSLPNNMEIWQINKKQKLYVHGSALCKGPYCSLHNPSEHSMKNFLLLWRDDRFIFERICSHGIGHPDPDGTYREWDMVHGCDGCCR